MSEAILTPIFDRINSFLSEIVKKEDIFASETFEIFMHSLSKFMFSVACGLLKSWLELNQPTENQLEHKGQKYYSGQYISTDTLKIVIINDINYCF